MALEFPAEPDENDTYFYEGVEWTFTADGLWETTAVGAVGPQGPSGPSGPSGPTGPTGPTIVYIWDGDSYESSPNARFFIGPEDPYDNGFTYVNGDIWEVTS